MANANSFIVRLLNRTKDGSALLASSNYLGQDEYCHDTQTNIISNTKNKVTWDDLFLPQKQNNPLLFNELPVFLQVQSINTKSKNNIRSVMWNSVDAIEVRSDAQFARLIEIEMKGFCLNDHNIEIISNYINENFVSKGILVDASIHKPNEKTNVLYLMCTLRSYENGFFTNKNRDWNTKEVLNEWKNQWELSQKNFISKDNEVKLKTSKPKTKP